MDKQELYQKAEKALNQAFETAKKSIKVVSEKAGEAANITRLLVEKVTLEHRVSRRFAELGSQVYKKSQGAEKSVSLTDPEIRQILDETQKLDQELSQVEATLERERRPKKAAKRK